MACAKVSRQLMKVFAVLKSAKSGNKSKIKGLRSKWHPLPNIQDFSPHAWMFGFWKQHMTHLGNNTARTIIQEMSTFLLNMQNMSCYNSITVHCYRAI